MANLPRGISRHVVRFVHVGDEVYAMKEITRQVAEREYEILRRLQKLELPTVTPIAVVIGRHTREGEPLEAILVTRHLKFSLPYRALFARNLRPDTAERLIDALAVLLVRLAPGRLLLGRCVPVERPVPARRRRFLRLPGGRRDR